MNFEPTESQELIRKTVRDFAEKKIAPRVMEFDESMEFPAELVRELGELGLLGIYFPPEYGGAGFGNLEYATAVEELGRVDSSIGLTVAAHISLCTNHIYLFGTEEQRQRWVKPLASGEMIGAWGLTEPQSGSDANALRTMAVRDGDGWVLNGTKTFCTNGRVGGVTVVLARTDNSKRGTVTAFAIDQGTPGLTVGKKENKLGMRASDTAEVILDNCRIPDANRLGGVGEGFTQAMKVLDGGRIGIAALALGIAQGAYEASIRYAKSRTAFGQAIGSFQAIQWKLADMAVEIEAARLLTYRAAVMKDEGKSTTLESAMAKLFASEVAVKVSNEAVQVHGGYGFVKDYPVEKFYRDSKLCTIGEGTSEIQRLVIARQVLEA